MRRLGTIETMAERYDLPLGNIPVEHREVPVFQNPRLRSAMGKARRRGDKQWIELHRFLARDPEKLKSTLAHEIAHVIAGIGSGHNAHWRRIAQSLGDTGNRCYTQAEGESIGIVRKTKLVAVCEGCGKEIHKARAYPRGRTYTHKGCGGNFRMIR